MGLIDSFAVPVAVSRAGVVTWANGEPTTGEPEALTIQASVQPAKARELLDFPEAERTTEWLRLYTATELKTADEEAMTVADEVTWRGKAYQVRSVEPWEAAGFSIEPFWKVLASKVDPADEVPPEEEP